MRERARERKEEGGREGEGVDEEVREAKRRKREGGRGNESATYADV